MHDLPVDLQIRLKACRTLPSVPAVVLEVLDLCQDEDVGVPKVARVLARDPALSAKVLKVANSAWYGVRSQVTTLDRALALLGINATLSLALSFSFVRSLRKDGKAHFDHPGYWRRSAIAAVASRVIGGSVSDLSGDELFLAGLLQDLGMLALNEAVPELYGPIVGSAKQDHVILAEIERQELGADHAAVGAWILGRWNLPVNLRSAIAGSHDPESITDPKVKPLGRTIAVASSVAEIWTNPKTGAATASARNAALSLLGMTPEKFENILADIASKLPEATSNLDIDIGGEETVNKLLDEAREALVVLNLQVQAQARELQHRSQVDRLTSLYNRAYLDEILPHYFDVSKRMEQPLSVVFIDLDHFKRVNDSYGHQAGDRVLIGVAKTLRSALRNPDIVVRYGGEEFLVVLPNTGDEGALLVGERLRAAVSKKRFTISDILEVGVTISVGVATMSDRRIFPTEKELIDTADKCLYVAKSAGRNKVITMNSPPLPQSVALA
jgi:diguanylate cyclase (GGDEF)-like protein